MPDNFAGLSNECAGVAVEMPRYRSHKQVWALELASADHLTCSVTFTPDGAAEYSPMTLPAEMWSRYKPVAGDFYGNYIHDSLFHS